MSCMRRMGGIPSEIAILHKAVHPTELLAGPRNFPDVECGKTPIAKPHD